MPIRFRRNIAPALAAMLLAAPAASQEVPSNGTVGAPELRNFRLPGTRVVPPSTNTEPATPPATTPPETARRTPPRTASATTAPRPAPSQAERPAARTSAPAPAPDAAAAAPPSSASEIRTERAPQIPLTAPSAAEAFPAEDLASSGPPISSQPLAETQDELSSSGSMWPALAAGLALLLGLFFYQKRRRTALAGEGSALARASLEAPEPEAPPRRRAPVQLRQEEEGPQPVLEMDFKPERMVATALQAAVHFDLSVRNSGTEPARNVRIEARMFNASAQQHHEIAAFLAAPAQLEAAGATLQPQQAAQMRSSVVMPKESVREIRIDGRPLFIPTVAVKIVYQWGRGRSGRMYRTYLVGIENQTSPEKMGPFRLDMGPRIYRSVGGRQIELARAS